MLDDGAAAEVMVEIEMVVDRGMNGSEFLHGLFISEFRYTDVHHHSEADYLR